MVPACTAVPGRGDNTWVSPDGCLMFSASRPLSIPGEQAPFINYVVCLGVVRGIQDTLGALLPTQVGSSSM
jgi:biotin-(acetyl-CoA carboxylase) ligase